MIINMEIVKYIFAVLIALPIAALGFYLLSQLVHESMSKKRPKAEGEIKRPDIEGFSIRLPDDK